MQILSPIDTPRAIPKGLTTPIKPKTEEVKYDVIIIYWKNTTKHIETPIFTLKFGSFISTLSAEKT